MIKVVTFNLRCANDPDGHSIDERAPRLKTVLDRLDAAGDVVERKPLVDIRTGCHTLQTGTAAESAEPTAEAETAPAAAVHTEEQEEEDPVTPHTIPPATVVAVVVSRHRRDIGGSHFTRSKTHMFFTSFPCVYSVYIAYIFQARELSGREIRIQTGA